MAGRIVQIVSISCPSDRCLFVFVFPRIVQIKYRVRIVTKIRMDME